MSSTTSSKIGAIVGYLVVILLTAIVFGVLVGLAISAWRYALG